MAPLSGTTDGMTVPRGTLPAGAVGVSAAENLRIIASELW